jgi:hypothetical protein
MLFSLRNKDEGEKKETIKTIGEPWKMGKLIFKRPTDSRKVLKLVVCAFESMTAFISKRHFLTDFQSLRFLIRTFMMNGTLRFVAFFEVKLIYWFMI